MGNKGYLGSRTFMQSACGLDGCGGSGEIRTRKTPVVLRRARKGRGGSKGVWAQSVQKRERDTERTRRIHACGMGLGQCQCHVHQGGSSWNTCERHGARPG